MQIWKRPRTSHLAVLRSRNCSRHNRISRRRPCWTYAKTVSTPSPITFCPKDRSAKPVTSQKRVCVGRLLRPRKTRADFDVAYLSLQAVGISSIREKTRHFYLRTEISISAAFVFELKRRLARISKKGASRKDASV